MNKEKFVQMAKQSGYSDDEIQDLLEFQEDSGIVFDDLPLMDKIED
ncbi:MAG: hypothetical protein HDR20_12455 [Lachnospiraceae bacterium]|nr:hypothetical protein [Lachnospiraceae bacterium]